MQILTMDSSRHLSSKLKVRNHIKSSPRLKMLAIFLVSHTEYSEYAMHRRIYTHRSTYPHLKYYLLCPRWRVAERGDLFLRFLRLRFSEAEINPRSANGTFARRKTTRDAKIYKQLHTLLHVNAALMNNDELWEFARRVCIWNDKRNVGDGIWLRERMFWKYLHIMWPESVFVKSFFSTSEGESNGRSKIWFGRRRNVFGLIRSSRCGDSGRIFGVELIWWWEWLGARRQVPIDARRFACAFQPTEKNMEFIICGKYQELMNNNINWLL